MNGRECRRRELQDRGRLFRALFQKEALRGVRHTLTLDLAIELGRLGFGSSWRNS